jgi:Carboxypeptidase regulatory-like domain
MSCDLFVCISRLTPNLSKDRGFRKQLILAFVLLIAGLLGLSETAYAQKGLTSLRGTITDPSGGTVSGVSLTLTDLASRAKRQLTTKDNGEYEYSALNPGRYRLDVTKSGF